MCVFDVKSSAAQLCSVGWSDQLNSDSEQKKSREED